MVADSFPLRARPQRSFKSNAQTTQPWCCCSPYRGCARCHHIDHDFLPVHACTYKPTPGHAHVHCGWCTLRVWCVIFQMAKSIENCIHFFSRRYLNCSAQQSNGYYGERSWHFCNSLSEFNNTWIQRSTIVLTKILSAGLAVLYHTSFLARLANFLMPLAIDMVPGKPLWNCGMNIETSYVIAR